MRILYLVPYVPSLIRVRPYNFIRQLVAMGHHVKVLTLASNSAEWEDVAHLKTICDVSAEALPRQQSLLNCAKAIPTDVPLQSVYCWSQKLADKAVQQLKSGKYDVLHVEHLRGVKYALYCQQAVPQIPVVWDSVDCISYLFEQAVQQSKSRAGQLMTRLDLGRTQRYERRIATHFDRTLVTSPLDKQAFEALGDGQSAENEAIEVVPNGVDLGYFSVGQTERHPAQIVISGKMSYHANQAMVRFLIEAVMPLVWDKCQQAEVMIVGKNPPPAIEQLGQHPNVTVTGEVPDLRPYLQQATLAVAPIQYGAGIQNKVLEAMACGTPIVVTPKAVAGLSYAHGDEFLVGRDSAEFSQHILQLLNNSELRQTLRTKARHCLERNYSWETVTNQLIGIYEHAESKRNVTITPVS